VSGAGYPRDRIESVLLKTRFPDSYRIMPERYRGSPLGASAADSRFCSRNAGYSVLYITGALRSIGYPAGGAWPQPWLIMRRIR